MERERSLDDELPDDEYGNHYREPFRPNRSETNTDLDEAGEPIVKPFEQPFDEEDDLPF